MQDHKILQSQLHELKEYIPEQELLQREVSIAPIGWHIAHALLVVNTIIERLKHSDPSRYTKTFSFRKTAVMLLNRIPRGKAKSPVAVRPPNDISEEFLQKHFLQAHNNILILKNLPEKAFFDHPFFNHLNRNETQKFLEIHTEHHLKIIRAVSNRK